MEIKIKLYSENAKVPTYANEHDGCFDLYAAELIHDPANGIVEAKIDVGFDIPEGCVGLIFQRSSVYKTPHLLRNCVGVIDCGFTDPITCKFLYVTNSPEQYKVGDRVAQMMIIPRPKIEFTVVEDFGKESRGGWGSTGNG